MRVLVLCFLLALPAIANDADPLDIDATPEYRGDRMSNRRRAEEIANDIQHGQDRLAARSDEAIGNMISLAVRTMERRGHIAEAAQIRTEFGERYQGYLTRMVAARGRGEMRGIGDHAPLVQWIDKAYKKIEGAIGITVCKMLHLSDLYSLNHVISITFNPCNFPMDAVTIARKDEYRNHFSGDGTYDGFAPILTYWCVWGACEAATWGGGAFFICSPLGSACEFAMEKFLAPKLSDAIYDRVCGPQ